MKLFHLIICFCFSDINKIIIFDKELINYYALFLAIHVLGIFLGIGLGFIKQCFSDTKEKKPSESDKKQTELATKYQTLKRETHQLVNLILLEENKDISYKIKRKAMRISTKLHTRHNEKLSAELSQKAWIASQEELEV